jgi:hypothetical protein
VATSSWLANILTEPIESKLTWGIFVFLNSFCDYGLKKTSLEKIFLIVVS